MLANKLILQPSRTPIDPEHRRREWIETEQGRVEAWVVRSAENRDHDNVDAIGIKFPGTAGRAERSGPHPFELWSDWLTEIWTINHHGYGGSDGKASLEKLGLVCEAVWSRIVQKFPGVPIVLVGNSLGCSSALYLSARYQPAGIYLRNPVPLHQMIATRPRYNWWNFGLARLIVKQIPAELDAVANAGRSTCPAFFVRSEKDRVVPTKYQAMIYQAYGGPKSEFVLAGARHHHPVPEFQVEDYCREAVSFLSQIRQD